MIHLTRLTVGYDRHEDRIAMDGESAHAGTCRLWLTRRFTDHLVAKLCEKLSSASKDVAEKVADAKCASPSPAQQVAQVYAQFEARISRKPGKPVQLAAADPHHLVTEARLGRRKSSHWRIEFAGPEFDGAFLILSDRQLRQWLEALYRNYGRARWPSTVWPAWITGTAPKK